MEDDILIKTDIYITKIIFLTFGFVPKTQVYFDSNGYVKILLDGSEDERKMMMGRNAGNFQAIKKMAQIFCRSFGHSSYLYIAPGKNATNISKDQERPNSDW